MVPQSETGGAPQPCPLHLSVGWDEGDVHPGTQPACSLGVGAGAGRGWQEILMDGVVYLQRERSLTGVRMGGAGMGWGLVCFSKMNKSPGWGRGQEAK